MKIEEFLERLNTQAQIAASRKITARMLEDWTYEGLIPGPTRIGGMRTTNWQWSEKSFAAALKVVEYRQRGFKRATAIRLQTWLENDLPASSIDICTITAEISRALRLVIRRVTSTHGFRSDFDLTAYRRKALLRTLGPLDHALERAELGAGSAVVLLAYELGRFGEQITPFDEKREPLAAWLAKWRVPNGAHVLSGMLEPDADQEFSIIQWVGKLTSGQLERCRTWAQNYTLYLLGSVLLLEQSGTSDIEKSTIFYAIDKIILTLQIWPWPIIVFATAINLVYHSEPTK